MAVPTEPERRLACTGAPLGQVAWLEISPIKWGRRACARVWQQPRSACSGKIRDVGLACLQDNYAFPRVERNLPQLSGFAASLKNKTNKYRSLNNQIAATRLLAQQGFDASK